MALSERYIDLNIFVTEQMDALEVMISNVH